MNGSIVRGALTSALRSNSVSSTGSDSSSVAVLTPGGKQLMMVDMSLRATSCVSLVSFYRSVSLEIYPAASDIPAWSADLE